VRTFAPTLYMIIDLAPGARLELPPAAERAIYVVDGNVTIDASPVATFNLAVLAPGTAWLEAPTGARVALIGGAPLDGPRTIWWNFVSSSRERIERARRDWQAQAFGRVPGETEFIPLP